MDILRGEHNSDFRDSLTKEAEARINDAMENLIHLGAIYDKTDTIEWFKRADTAKGIIAAELLALREAKEVPMLESMDGIEAVRAVFERRWKATMTRLETDKATLQAEVARLRNNPMFCTNCGAKLT